MSNKKRNAVKRQGRGGKPQGSNYSQVLQAKMDAEHSVGSSAGKIIEQEMLLIAMKRCGMLGEKRLRQLNEELKQVRQEFREMATIDVSPHGNNDKHWDYTKGKLDEALKWAVGDDNFVPFEVRQNQTLYSDGIRVLELRQMVDRMVDERVRKLDDERRLQEGLQALKEQYS